MSIDLPASLLWIVVPALALWTLNVKKPAPIRADILESDSILLLGLGVSAYRNWAVAVGLFAFLLLVAELWLLVIRRRMQKERRSHIAGGA